MDYSKLKLVVTDMDGTLLHSDHTLNKEFFTIYEKLKRLDIKFAVASGRQYYSLLGDFESIKDEIYFIAENGGNVVHDEKQLFVHKLDQEVINEVAQLILPLPDTQMLLCGVNSAYIEEGHYEFEKQIAPYYPKRKIIADFQKKLNDQIVKIAIYNSDSSEENILPLVEHLSENYQVVISGKNWLDISVNNANKGFALKEIQEILKISKDETMAFGDYLNDLGMFNESYFSYAMKNAHPKLKEIAKFEADTNDEDGVLKVLKEVIAQRGL
ncbi:Cof-type HAD-IIB family hydrolase [Apibacter sp.]|uniref:Cof-type HAD-IIB family hydrolase n=1 Tax=Apibacter sp. TaxID=2023709 RepID=UPI0025D31D76|nr:Cof-type HAD-IIB family hydrolase [Apibacter sp.]MCT6869308.1 Cof-type HAD-IIB family hydrolase [Apibacter sp.]